MNSLTLAMALYDHCGSNLFHHQEPGFGDLKKILALSELAQYLHNTVSKVLGDLPLLPVKPQYVYLQDNMTTWLLVGANSISGAGAQSKYSQDKNPGTKNGLRVKSTFIFNAMGQMATPCISVSGLNDRELPLEFCPTRILSLKIETLHQWQLNDEKPPRDGLRGDDCYLLRAFNCRSKPVILKSPAPLDAKENGAGAAPDADAIPAQPPIVSPTRLIVGYNSANSLEKANDFFNIELVSRLNRLIPVGVTFMVKDGPNCIDKEIAQLCPKIDKLAMLLLGRLLGHISSQMFTRSQHIRWRFKWFRQNVHQAAAYMVLRRHVKDDLDLLAGPGLSALARQA